MYINLCFGKYIIKGKKNLFLIFVRRQIDVEVTLFVVESTSFIVIQRRSNDTH